MKYGYSVGLVQGDSVRESVQPKSQGEAFTVVRRFVDVLKKSGTVTRMDEVEVTSGVFKTVWAGQGGWQVVLMKVAGDEPAAPVLAPQSKAPAEVPVLMDVATNADFHKYYDRAINDQKMEPCIICGRGVRPDGFNIYAIDGGGAAVLPAHVHEAQYSDGWWWKIGPDCLHQHPELVPYAVKQLPSAPAKEVAQEERPFRVEFSREQAFQLGHELDSFELATGKFALCHRCGQRFDTFDENGRWLISHVRSSNVEPCSPGQLTLW